MLVCHYQVVCVCVVGVAGCYVICCNKTTLANCDLKVECTETSPANTSKLLNIGIVNGFVLYTVQTGLYHRA